ncbi:MAG: hypothetical protein QOG80_3061 [Pseudonocardiales bacterium]|jgi:uncharacterized membrane protein (DUF485 family)|nr:hypothetical protein [Pseudonocardiales bacterium]
MQDVSDSVDVRGPVSSTLQRRRIDRACYLTGLAFVAAGLLHLAVAASYPRPWLGPLSWRKPVTFGVSFGVVLISITWVTSYLRMPARRRTLLLGIFVADSVVEVAGITVQAWRRVPSHLNNVGLLNAAIAYSLAVGGGVLLVTLGAFAIPALRGESDAAPSMRLALRAGFGLLMAGLVAGIAMIARGEELIQTGHRNLAYDAAGFLKWFHAIALHAVLVLPAIAWLLGRTARSEDERYRIVRLAIGGYLAAAATALILNLAFV